MTNPINISVEVLNRRIVAVFGVGDTFLAIHPTVWIGHVGKSNFAKDVGTTFQFARTCERNKGAKKAGWGEIDAAA